MPLRPGHTPAVVSQNIQEFTGGPKYEQTSKKFGARKAHQQAVAVALSNARKDGVGKQNTPGAMNTAQRSVAD